jgi:hypothetical protein
MKKKKEKPTLGTFVNNKNTEKVANSTTKTEVKPKKIVKFAIQNTESKPITTKKFTLKINNKYFIVSDGTCVSLYQKTWSENTKKFMEKNIGHFSNLNQACGRLLEEMLADKTKTDLEGVKGFLYDIGQEIKRAITENIKYT